MTLDTIILSLNYFCNFLQYLSIFAAGLHEYGFIYTTRQLYDFMRIYCRLCRRVIQLQADLWFHSNLPEAKLGIFISCHVSAIKYPIQLILSTEANSCHGLRLYFSVLYLSALLFCQQLPPSYSRLSWSTSACASVTVAQGGVLAQPHPHWCLFYYSCYLGRNSCMK